MCAAGSAKSRPRSPLVQASLKSLLPGESEQPPAVSRKCERYLQEESTGKCTCG